MATRSAEFIGRAAPNPPILQGDLENEARHRAVLFLIQTIRHIQEDIEALHERETILSALCLTANQATPHSCAASFNLVPPPRSNGH